MVESRAEELDCSVERACVALRSADCGEKEAFACAERVRSARHGVSIGRRVAKVFECLFRGHVSCVCGRVR